MVCYLESKSSKYPFLSVAKLTASGQNLLAAQAL